MTDDVLRRARRAARITTYLESDDRFSAALRNRDRELVPTNDQLLMGYPYAHGDLHKDVPMWAREIAASPCRLKLSGTFLDALQAFEADPQIYSALALEGVALRLRNAGEQTLAAMDVLDVYTDAADRATLYAAEWGDADAAGRAVAIALSMFASYAYLSDSDPAVVREMAVSVIYFSRLCRRDPNAPVDPPWDFDLAGATSRGIERDRARQDANAMARVMLPPEDLGAVKPDAAPHAWVGDLAALGRPVEDPGILVIPPVGERKVPTLVKPVVGKRLPCVPMPDLQELGERLTERAPWLAPTVSRMIGMAQGRPHAGFPNILLVGPAGGGKTQLSREFVAGLGLPTIVYACGGVSDGSFAGTNAQWSTARASTPLQVLIASGSGNGTVQLDELDKAAAPGGHNGSLREALLALAEPSTRKAFFDTGLELNVNLSGISLIATANSIEPLRGPLLDRFAVIQVPAPRKQDLDVIVRGILTDLRSEVSDPRWIPDLDRAELGALRRAWTGGSIRPVRRAVERLVALRSDHRFAH